MATKRIDAYDEIDALADNDEFLAWDASSSKVVNVPPTKLAAYTNTYTVGPANSGAAYITDGTSDEAQIKNALTAAQPTGATVYIKEGTYDWSSQVVFHNKNDITIKGAGIGKTILQKSHSDNRSMLDIGDGNGPTEIENVYISDLTIDLNNTGTGWGLVITWAKNVLIERCSFVNPPTNMKAALFVGKFSGGSEDWEATNITVKDCIFDASTATTLSWEYVGVIAGYDVTFEGCRFYGPTASQTRPMLLGYQSDQMRVQNCFFDHARHTIGGRGNYSVINTQYEQSYLFVDQAKNVYIGGGTSFKSRGTTTGYNNGIRFQGGYKTTSDPETPWYITSDTAFSCDNVIIDGVIFKDVKDNAIYAKTTTENSTEVLDVRDITIQNCKIENVEGIPIVAFGERVKIIDNEIVEGNTLNSSTKAYHLYVAGSQVDISGNYGSSTNVSTDVIVDEERFTSLIATTELNYGVNNFTSTKLFEFFDSGGTKQNTATTNVNLNFSGGYPLIGAANAHYITDGTADDVQIQAAIDAANAAGGGTVYIQAGTYTLAARVNIAGVNKVTVIGDGIDTTILTEYGFYKNNATTTSNCHFRDFTIDINNRAGENAMNLNSNCDDFTLTRVKLQDTNDRFLLHWGTMDNFIARDCIFVDGGRTVAADNCAGSQDSTTEGVSKFINCHFIATSAKTAGGGLLTTGQTGNLTVIGCSFDNSGEKAYAGISLEHQAGNSKNFICEGNKFYKCGVQTGVTSVSSTLKSALIIGNEVTGDVAIGASGGGIIKIDNAELGIVANNTINDSKQGIWLTDTTIAIASDNIIQDTNTNSHGTTSDKGGIYISGNTVTKVSDNIVRDTGGTTPYGIYIVGGTNRIYIENNKLEGPFTTDSMTISGTQSYLRTRNNYFSDTPALGTITTHDAKDNDGYNLNYAAKTAAYTLTKANESGVVDFTGATTANATLPSSGNVTGDTYTIKNSGTGTITVVGTIDGATNYSLSTQYSFITVVYNGTDWSITNKS